MKISAILCIKNFVSMLRCRKDFRHDLSWVSKILIFFFFFLNFSRSIITRMLLSRLKFRFVLNFFFFFKEKFSIELNLCKGADQRDLMLCLVIINEFSGWVCIIFIINILVLEKFYFISNDVCFKLKLANLIMNFNFLLETQTKAILIIEYRWFPYKINY